jgi:hypothetical protein
VIAAVAGQSIYRSVVLQSRLVLWIPESVIIVLIALIFGLFPRCYPTFIRAVFRDSSISQLLGAGLSIL